MIRYCNTIYYANEYEQKLREQIEKEVESRVDYLLLSRGEKVLSRKWTTKKVASGVRHTYKCRCTDRLNYSKVATLSESYVILTPMEME